MFGVACCGALPKPEQQATTRTNGRKPILNVDKMSTVRPTPDHTLKEGTNRACRRFNDLPETFTFLELSFVKRILR